MRALQFVPIKPKPDRRSHPTRRFYPACAYQRPAEAGHKRARWHLSIIIDWEPDGCPLPVCEDCKADWERGSIVLPSHVVVGRPKKVPAREERVSDSARR